MPAGGWLLLAPAGSLLLAPDGSGLLLLVLAREAVLDALLWSGKGTGFHGVAELPHSERCDDP